MRLGQSQIGSFQTFLVFGLNYGKECMSNYNISFALELQYSTSDMLSDNSNQEIVL